MLAPRERLPALSSLRHTNLTRRIDPRHPGTSEILHPQKNMNSEFQNSTHGKRASFSQNSKTWRPFSENVCFSPKSIDFCKKWWLSRKIPDFPETIPACLNFGHRHMFFLYPKKLSCSSRNTYIKNIRVRLLGKASCLLKKLKKRFKTNEFCW